MAEPTEKSLLVQSTEGRPARPPTNCVGKYACKFFWKMFDVFCFLAGQYLNFNTSARPPSGSHPDPRPEPPPGFSCKKLTPYVAFGFFLGQIIVCFGYVGTALVVEVDTIGNASHTIINVSHTNSSVYDNSTCMLPQEHWKFTTAITIGTFAAFFSYSLMTFVVLIPVNCLGCCSSQCCGSNGCCSTYKQVLSDAALSPYNDDNDSTNLSPEQTRYFFINYLFVIVLFLCNCVSSVAYVISVYNSNCDITSWYLAMMILHLSSQFCAIHSCFIFSKIIYKVTNKLQKLVTDTDQVDFQEQNKALAVQNIKDDDNLITLVNRKVDKGRFSWLQKTDQDFIKQVKPMLKLFGVWFLVHWILFALTTVLLSAFIMQIAIEVVQYDLNSVEKYLPKGEADTKAPYVLYVLSFTLIHGYLFLYPCFRAAAIATARTKAILAISEKRWDNIPLSVQTSFVHYLISKNFAFQVPLFCASISIEFNWIFVSFFVPILGAYLSF